MTFQVENTVFEMSYEVVNAILNLTKVFGLVKTVSHITYTVLAGT